MIEGMIVPIVNVLLPMVVSWKAPEKYAKLTTLVLVLYANRLLLVVVVILIVLMVSLSRTVMGVM